MGKFYSIKKCIASKIESTLRLASSARSLSQHLGMVIQRWQMLGKQGQDHCTTSLSSYVAIVVENRQKRSGNITCDAWTGFWLSALGLARDRRLECWLGVHGRHFVTHSQKQSPYCSNV